MKINRTIICGDVHGCLTELNELLEKIKFNIKTDRLIGVGDLIDRGPYSVEVIRKMRELGAECTMGNHEYKFIKWFKNQGTEAAKFHDAYPHYSQFSDEDVNYIFRMPLYITIDNYIIVHAGLRANIALANQRKEDLMYIRYIDKDYKFISLKKIFNIGKETAGAHFWTEFWKGPESIIYGHNVHSCESPLIEEVSPGVTCYGLDTGVCFGGKLTAMILETKEIIQVPARKVYFESGFK